MNLYNFGKRVRLSVLLSLLFFTSYGQLTVTDTGNCVNHVLHASVTGTMPTGTGITLDDGYSGVFPIGFTFNFYGVPYTQLVIGSNGVINFTTSLAGAYCPWPISAPLLGNPSMRNAVCGPWCDIMISAGGSITYSTAGVAPNRKFAVTWCASGMFSCTTQWTTSQIILYEGSDVVEVHTAHKTVCAWNGGYAITGIQNAAGTAACVAPGRDYPSVWSVISPPEAWRFTPGVPSSTTYTVAPIPYSPLPYATSAVYWYDSTTGAYLGTGPYLTVSPTVTTTYKAAALGCNDTTFAYMTVNPPSVGIGGVPHIIGRDTLNPSECGACDGRIVLRGVNPHQIDTVFWSYNGVAQPSYVDSAALDSTITLDNLCGGTYDYIYVKVGDCPSNQVSVHLVTPVLAISSVTKTDPTVCGKKDGTITLHGLTPLKPVSVAYNFGGVPQAPVTGIVAGDSTFTMPGLGAGNYTGIAATVRYCTATAPPVALINPPPYPASYTFDTALGCNGDTVFVTNTSTPSGYYSYWNWGDGSPLDSMNNWHVYKTQLNSPKYTGSYNLSLTYNTTIYHDPACASTQTYTVDIDHQIKAIFAPNVDTVCRDVLVDFANSSISNNGPTYYWLFDDGFYDDGTENPSHAYAAAGRYNVTLTVTDTLGCSDKVSHPVEVVSLDLYGTFADTNVCLRTPMPVKIVPEVKMNSNMPVNYVWMQAPAGGNLDHYDVENPYFSGVGDYTLTVNANTAPFTGFPFGCTDDLSMVIHSHPPVTITNLTESPQIIKVGSSIRLNADGGVYYQWSPSTGVLDNPNINNPVATLFDSVTVFTVRVMNLWGCMDSASVTIRADQEAHEFVPSAFTPNGDGRNDVFRLIRFQFDKLVDFRVYNRWGTCVFQTSNPEQGWDGTYKGEAMDMGTYNYEIIVAQPNGENKSYKGNVTLIR